MQFPERELEILQLADDMSHGLRRHQDVYPAPLVTPEQIAEALSAYHAARAEREAARARLKAGAVAKKDALKRLKRLLRTGVKYAQAMSQGDAARLYLLGWGPRRRPRRTPTEAPGQVTRLESREEGPNWVVLHWEAPHAGGPVAAYRVLRRYLKGGDWTHAGSSIEPGIRLEDQDRGVELEYRVVAINAEGEGPPSNSVRVVL